MTATIHIRKDKPPRPKGPPGENPRVREMAWCHDCFEHGMRSLKLLARTDL